MGHHIRFGQDDALRFAAWSGDRNPLHVDPAAARRSVFGQSVLHGILTTLRTLESAPDLPSGVRSLDVEFRHAVHPDQSCAVDDSGPATLTLRSGDDACLIIRADQAAPTPELSSWIADAVRQYADLPIQRSEPADLEPRDLPSGREVVAVYRTAPVPAEYLAGGRLRPVQARALALCSYVVGMELPGLRSLFTRLRLVFADSTFDGTDLLYRARVQRFDPHFRLLDLTIEIATPTGEPVASGELRAYVRFTPVTMDVAETAFHIGDGRPLDGKVALIVGGTRGLGAELTTALAAAGCRVHASFANDRDSAEDLKGRLLAAGHEIELLQGDAADAEWCRTAVGSVVDRHGRLDLLVLNACAPPSVLKFSAATADRYSRYISDNLLQVQAPLAAALPALTASSGTILGISSSFVAAPPPGFGHYVALKQAMEATLQTTANEVSNLRVLVTRPPRLQTAWNDTPTGVPDTIAARDAAVQIVRALADDAGPSFRVQSEFSPLPAYTPSSAAPLPAVEFSIALSASFTAEPLVPAFEFWLKTLGLQGEVAVAPYGQVLQTLLNPVPPFSGAGAHVVMLRVRDWLRELRAEDAASPSFVEAYLESTAQDLERAVRAHRGHASHETTLVLCPSVPETVDEIEQLVERTEDALLQRLSGIPGLTIVRARDFDEIYEIDPSAIADHVREHLAHIPYRTPCLHTLATIAMRHAYRKLSPRRKLIAVDCDNTLWGGVVGEVGAEGVVFNDAHLALHQTLNRLADNGVLIALCSKNEEADVWRVFETRPDLALARERVVAGAINWMPKSSNLRSLAERLNLGLDSFVFIDDNPVECAEVRGGCPQVLTLEWPQDPVQAIRLLRHTWELDAREATAEDKRRTELYKEEFRRQESQSQALTFRDFIASLELVLDVAPLTPADLKRASQLTLRTNQFNFTTRRRDEGEMQALMSAGTHEIRTVRVRDRFGDYGLVGLLIAEVRPDEIFADTFLLSCRVLGRGVEHRMIAELGRMAAERWLPTVRLRVDPTKRNTPARNFLASITPAEYRRDAGESLQAEIPADVAAAITFEPPDHAPAPVADDAAPRQSGDSDADRVRARETQIARTYALASATALADAIDGPSAAPRPAAPADTGFVFEAFARVLGVPVDEVRRIDTLEGLGCDSFRIVEITVSLLEKYPQLPGTLLFEHRRVSQIAEHIARLGQDSAVEATGSSPALHGARTATGDIAVVGLHLRCAGARSPQELWDLLSNGRIAVTPVPPDRRHFFGRLDDDRQHFAGLLDDVDRFEPELFGITPREADLMDPQLRLFLEVAWGALEDAGCLGEELDPGTGVFAGVMYSDYAQRANRVARASDSPLKSWEGFSLANRLSQVFGFRGPSITVDTACSSSGTALHLACRALNAGDCRIALAGGVNLILDPDRFVQLGRLGILSSSGRCVPFGAEADGTVLGEGAGIVVLRPLEDALARGDRIYGVIKGTGVSTGSGTVGFTAPNPVAQSEAVRRSVRAAGIDPRTIGYVETHGTGTVLGDPIEVRGLTLAYTDRALWDTRLEARASCGIGSIKPNIGHLEAGAGVLGFIKLLLQLQHRTLLPSACSDDANPQIPFGELPFAIQRTLQPWPEPDVRVQGQVVRTPRRGALNSFGVGGANAHIIVEEPPDIVDAASEADRPLQVLTVSTRSDEALRQRLVDVARVLERGEVPVEDLAFTLNTAQRPLDTRAAVVAATAGDMARTLRELAESGEAPGAFTGAIADKASPQIVFLFTGQGSQWPGMGRDLYETQPVFREALDRCFTLFAPLLEGEDLAASFFAADGTPAAARLHQTGLTQPALFSLGYALSELWKSWGIVPDAVLGHSIGEITAMCVAGGLSLDDAVKMVAARGTLMQALPRGGAMTSVMTTEAQALEAIADLDGRVGIAAINSPQQVVLSGEADAVQDAAARLAATGVKTRELVVSHAFHSPMMRPMLASYEQILTTITFTPPKTLFVSSVLGAVAQDEITTPAYWLRNVIDPVRFADGIRQVAALGVDACVEIGPQPVLTGLGRQTIGDEQGPALWLTSLRKDSPSWSPILSSLSQLFVAGARVDWRAFDAPYPRRRVAVPPYPFTGRRHWIVSSEPAIERQAASTTAASAGARAYEITWRPATLPSEGSASGRWLLITDDTALGGEVTRVIHERGGTASTLPVAQALRELGALETTLDGLRGVVYLPAPSIGAGPLDAASSATSHAGDLLAVLRTHARATTATPVPMWIVTRQGVRLGADTAPTDLAHASLWGAVRSFALEHPESFGGLVDLGSSFDAASAAARVVAELSSGAPEDQVAIRADGRFVARLVQQPARDAAALTLGPAESGVVTGGLGALGLRTANWLVDRGARHLVLVSRTGASSPDAQAAVKALESRGASVRLVTADVGTPDGVDRVLASVDPAAPLSAIFHLAGRDDTTPVRDLDRTAVAGVFDAKASGAWLLHEKTQHLPLRMFVCYSSIAAVLGSPGRAAYAAANAFLDALVTERRRTGRPGLSINWGPWSGGGMATAAALESYARAGNRGLDPAAALAVLERLIVENSPGAMVADIDWAVFRPAYEARRPRPLVSEIDGQAPRADAPAATRQPAWINALASRPPDQRLAELVSLIQQEVAQTLGFDDPAAIAVERPFRDLGMDSLMSAEFAGRLQKKLGVKSTAMVFEYPTVAKLAARVLDVVSLPAPAPEPVGANVAVAAPPSSASTPSSWTLDAFAQENPSPTVASPAPGAGTVLRYAPALESEAIAFQRIAYPARPADLVPLRWRWMFVESARRLGIEPQVWLHREDGRIVGHNGSIPVRLTIGHDERQTGWLVDTMVLADYRSAGVGARLMLEAQDDMPFALSLGQTEQMREILLRLGWRQIAPLQTAQFLIRPERVLQGKLPQPAALAAGLALRAGGALRGLRKGRGGATVRELARFDERHDQLWIRSAADITCTVRRDASYLNWKYVDQPGQTFLRLEVTSASGAQGLVVLMFRDPDGIYKYRRGFIVDVVAPLGDDELMTDVIEAAIRAAGERGADALLCLHINARLTAALQRAGFRLREPTRFLLVRPGPSDPDTANQLLDPSGWFITQGDSDIDRP